MRLVTLAAALLLAAASPLAAQDDVDSSAPDSAPGPIVLLTGPDALLAKFGSAPLDPEARLCLGADETAVLASDRVTLQIADEGCYTAALAEEEAFANEQLALEQQALEAAAAQFDAANETGDEAEKERAFERYAEAARQARAEEWVDEVAREREAAAAARAREERMMRMPPTASRPRTGSTRPPPRAATPPRPIIFRLAGASPAVLQRYPRGTLVQRSTALCLADGEQATISASNGQTTTYSGPGCLRRKAQPSATNIGGFTFG